MCRVGARADIQLKNFGEKATRDTSFIGQMGAIYLFDDALSPIQIQSIYNLGPNYLGNFLFDQYYKFLISHNFFIALIY